MKNNKQDRIMGKGYEEGVHREETGIPGKHMRKCSVSLVIGEMQTKMRNDFLPLMLGKPCCVTVLRLRRIWEKSSHHVERFAVRAATLRSSFVMFS